MPQRQSLRNVHYAILKQDDTEGVAYEAPLPLVGAISAKVSPTSNQEKLWADDRIFDIAANLGEITLEMELVSLPLKAQAVLLGHTYEDGVLTKTDTDEPPYLAIGFMSQPQPGRFQLVWLYKGKFALIQDEFGTATDTAAWRTAKLTGTFVKQYQVIRYISQRMYENEILTKDELDMVIRHYQETLHPLFGLGLDAIGGSP